MLCICTFCAMAVVWNCYFHIDFKIESKVRFLKCTLFQIVTIEFISTQRDFVNISLLINFIFAYKSKMPIHLGINNYLGKIFPLHRFWFQYLRQIVLWVIAPSFQIDTISIIVDQIQISVLGLLSPPSHGLKRGHWSLSGGRPSLFGCWYFFWLISCILITCKHCFDSLILHIFAAKNEKYGTSLDWLLTKGILIRLLYKHPLINPIWRPEILA